MKLIAYVRVLFQTTFCVTRIMNLSDKRPIRNACNIAAYLPTSGAGHWALNLCSYFGGANFPRQQLLQCSSRETLAIGSAFKRERGWMDGACFHGDESVARVLIMLLRRGSGAGNSEPCAPDAMVQRLRRIPLWSHLTSTPTLLLSHSCSLSLSSCATF